VAAVRGQLPPVSRHAVVALARLRFREAVRLEERLAADTADRYFDSISAALARPDFLPRALFERFNIEALATTESPIDELRATPQDPRERLAGAGDSPPIGRIPWSIRRSEIFPQALRRFR